MQGSDRVSSTRLVFLTRHNNFVRSSFALLVQLRKQKYTQSYKINNNQTILTKKYQQNHITQIYMQKLYTINL